MCLSTGGVPGLGVPGLGGCLVHGGAWSQLRCLVPGGVPGPGGLESQRAQRQTPTPGETATAADGMHPTGMYSCIHF